MRFAYGRRQGEEVGNVTREYAEAYVRWADSDGFNLNFTSENSVIYGGFTVIFLFAAVAARRFVFASMLFVLFLGHCILFMVLKRKMQTLTYVQKFLNIGLSGVFTRFMFLLMSLTILEVTGGYGIWAYLRVVFVWLLINLLDFGFIWWRIQSRKYSVLQERMKERKKWKGKQGQKRRGGILLSAVICVVVCLVGTRRSPFLKRLLAGASQAFAVHFGVWLFVAIGILLGMGSNELWKAYYVKKYDIQGRSIPAYMPRPGEKQTGTRSILHTLEILGRTFGVIVAFCLAATLIMVFFMRWLPEWLG